GQRMFAMLDYLRFSTSVPRKLNEFAILIQAWLWTSQVAWTVHYPLALKAGLPQAVADDLKVGKRSASMQPDEATVYEFCMDLAKDHVVTNATFKKARELFSDQQIVDLIMVSGVYITLAMLSNTAETSFLEATPQPCNRSRCTEFSSKRKDSIHGNAPQIDCQRRPQVRCLSCRSSGDAQGRNRRHS